jgi:hypothetical protein
VPTRKRDPVRNDDDEFMILLVAAVAVTIFGPGLAAQFIPQVSEALVRWNILVTEGILVPIGDSAGLDLARVTIAGGLVALLVLLLVVLVRSKAARKRRS